VSDYVTLGRAGTGISVVGLGCGGFRQLGLAKRKRENDGIAMIRQALDLKVTFFDTAADRGRALADQAAAGAASAAIFAASSASAPARS
jgi:aryl-alcohol dehydrogenase-like predicted oxidoreductase